MRSAWFGLIVAGVVPASCSAPTLRADFGSIDPAERVRAIAATAREIDSGEVRDAPRTAAELIEELHSSDPAVRMIAIDTLRRLTGERFGYDWSAPAGERREAIGRWAAWRESGSGGVRAADR